MIKLKPRNAPRMKSKSFDRVVDEAMSPVWAY